MLVKAKEKEISFLLQEHDPFLEIGCRVLEQEQVREMLPYRRKQQSGREKLVFKAQGEDLVLLRDIVPALGGVNHTLVNGIMIPPYELMELENNDILSVADIEFRVTTAGVV